MILPQFKRRFSIGNSDDPKAEYSAVARALMNSSEDVQGEIADVYFGRAFLYEINGQKHRYGDVMGKEASDAQVRDLLKMQEKTGIAISITFNEMNFSPEVVGHKGIREGFVKYLRSFYAAGVRVCTISDIHLMSTGVLQEAFPEMHWKNTVNHIVRTAQEVVDYSRLGFNTILIDRSLNRDVEELKRVKKVAEKLGMKVSLLASEGCMPSCPFKREHDLVQPAMQNGYNPTMNASLKTYWGVLGDLSCNRWRLSDMTRLEDEYVEDQALMPRQGTDIVALDRATLDVYLQNTDILKFSGRLAQNASPSKDAGYVWSSRLGRSQTATGFEGTLSNEIMAANFSEIYERNLFPFHTWWLGQAAFKEGVDKRAVMDETQRSHAERFETSVWSKKKAKALNKTLLTCKNQCYDCHACERVFGYQDFDTLLELKKPTDWLKKADKVIPIHQLN